MQFVPTHAHALGRFVVASRQQSASAVQVAPSWAVHAVALAQLSAREHKCVPVVSSTQQPLPQSVPALHDTEHTCPRPQSRAQSVGDPWSAQQSVLAVHASPAAAVHIGVMQAPAMHV